MRRFCVLDTRPRQEEAISRDWENEECLALQNMIEREIGGPPSSAHFDRIHLSFSHTITDTRTQLGIWYNLNDPEAISYVAMVEEVMERKTRWDEESLRFLGEAYISIRTLLSSQERSDDS